MELSIGGRKVGDGHPVFIAAEIGINHNGDMALAKRQIEAAKLAGADSVKFQNYRTEDFVPDRSLPYTYVSQGKEITESQYEMFKRSELTPVQLRELKAHCDEIGILFHSTPTNTQGIQDLVEIGAPVLKNGSDFLRHLPLIRAMAATGLPTVLSTGMATEQEIRDAVEAFRESGESLILLHCTSSYPTPPASVSLPTIPLLRERFSCLVGFSDHTEGIEAAIGAVALGACWIEKHFTSNKNLPGPDHRFSCDPEELAALVRGVRVMEQMMVPAGIGPKPSERENRLQYQVSCAAARDLPKGHVLAESDIGFYRPGTGVPPKDVGTLIGRKLRCAVAAGKLVTADLLE